MVILKFGKYRGENICSVPSEYLQYLLISARQTIAECEAELERRALAEEAQLTVVERIVEIGYRELAKRVHPDIGGNDADMQALNAAREALRERVAAMPER